MPTVRVEPLEAALEEARQATEWYAQRSASVADRFIEALRRATTALAEDPEAWPRFEGDTRRCLVRGFPYSVVYRATADVVYVIAIAHASRRPGYWRQR